VLSVDTTRTGNACIVIGIGRRIAIRFVMPVDAGQFTVRD
jgi:hypothetical protein